MALLFVRHWTVLHQGRTIDQELIVMSKTPVDAEEDEAAVEAGVFHPHFGLVGREVTLFGFPVQKVAAAEGQCNLADFFLYADIQGAVLLEDGEESSHVAAVVHVGAYFPVFRQGKGGIGPQSSCRRLLSSFSAG